MGHSSRDLLVTLTAVCACPGLSVAGNLWWLHSDLSIHDFLLRDFLLPITICPFIWIHIYIVIVRWKHSEQTIHSVCCWKYCCFLLFWLFSHYITGIHSVCSVVTVVLYLFCCLCWYDVSRIYAGTLTVVDCIQVHFSGLCSGWKCYWKGNSWSYEHSIGIDVFSLVVSIPIPALEHLLFIWNSVPDACSHWWFCADDGVLLHLLENSSSQIVAFAGTDAFYRLEYCTRDLYYY